MNLDFSEEQNQLRDQVRRFLEERCPPKAVRQVLEGETDYDAGLYKGLAELGVLGAAIPEEYGGVGLGHLELCVLTEELGRVLAPVPVASSVYLVAEALMQAGSEDQKSEWLPQLAAGDAIGCWAINEGSGRMREEKVSVRFENGKLTGKKSPVADGAIADIAIVAAREGDGISLVMVDLSACQ